MNSEESYRLFVLVVLAASALGACVGIGMVSKRKGKSTDQLWDEDQDTK